MKIEYFLSDPSHTLFETHQGFNEWQKFKLELRKLVERADVKRVLEVGGGAHPLLSLEEIERYGLEYTVFDISSEELRKAPDGYIKIQGDIADPRLSLDKKYDLVCSRFVAEHVPSGHIFHKNVLGVLREEGYAFHAFPTLYTTPFVTNLLLPDGLTDRIILLFQPWRTKGGTEGKFKAHYDWCYGPSKRNIQKLINLGYSLEEYIAFFGHRYYSNKKLLKILDLLEIVKSNLLVNFPVPLLTTFAHVLLKKKRTSLGILNYPAEPVENFTHPEETVVEAREKPVLPQSRLALF